MPTQLPLTPRASSSPLHSLPLSVPHGPLWSCSLTQPGHKTYFVYLSNISLWNIFTWTKISQKQCKPSPFIYPSSTCPKCWPFAVGSKYWLDFLTTFLYCLGFKFSFVFWGPQTSYWGQGGEVMWQLAHGHQLHWPGGSPEPLEQMCWLPAFPQRTGGSSSDCPNGEASEECPKLQAWEIH